MKKFLISLFVTLFHMLTGFCVGLYLFYPRVNYNITEIKPCNCLTHHQIMLYQYKYDMFIDTLNYGRKADKPRIADSVRKYGTLLKHNDQQN